MESYSFKNVDFTYPEGEKKALRNISFTVQQGEFVILCGPSGCGKSTLLRHLKSCLTPHGLFSGEIRYQGRLLSEMSQREQAQQIGYVLQSPENQVVTDKVWHELAFGFRYFPSIRYIGLNSVTLSFQFVYVIMCLMPVVLNWAEERKWKAIHSKM